MRLYDTLTRATIPFVPVIPGKASIYLCGPTVQSAPHLGHGRSAVAFDVLSRYLTWVGYEVDFVRNVTDIDDKIIRKAIELGSTTEEVAAEAWAAFSDAYERLGNLEPRAEPRATEHIPQMIEMIEVLIASDHAYEVEGDVYFAVRSFPSYGKLSRHDIADLRSGERVEVDARKSDPVDFALWKAAKPGEPSWKSPWGEGRPGWHIECSAMAREYLGDGFDIHAGGSDLIFPHHENEIAQSEAATGEVFARHWMHNGMLNLSGEKMAKSSGHVVTLLGALDEWDPLAVRLFYLRTHYRKPLDYSESALLDAEASLRRLRAFRRRSPASLEGPGDVEILDAFMEAMDDDLDVAGALAVIFDTVRHGNAGIDAGEDIVSTVAAFDEMMDVLGLTAPDSVHGNDASVGEFAEQFGLAGGSIDDLLEVREKARREKDWETADAIRVGLGVFNITIEDTADGARWHRN